MNYGLQLAASGALTGLYRMDVLANNLANVNTAAFKPDIPALQQRAAARQEDGLVGLPSNVMLERLGGGVFAAPNRVRFEQGPLQRSGNPLDVAIQGDGFFVVRDTAGEGADRMRLTRDGRFARDAQGRLVLASSGLPVMDTSNRPIVIEDEAPVQIAPDGTVRQGGAVVGRIQLIDVPDRSRLTKLGQSMYVAPADEMNNAFPATGQIRQYQTEGSAVDAISALMALTEAQRSVETAAGLIQGHDRLAERAINGLGRVA